MAIITLGIDIAKKVFALHGVNDAGKPVLLKPRVPRAKLLGRLSGKRGFRLLNHGHCISWD